MTTEFLIYLAKVALSILLLMGLFKLALAADRSFARNRFYLMGAILWSIAIPLLTMQHGETAEGMMPAIVITPTYTINLPELVVTAQGADAQGSAWGDPTTVILTIYLTGVAIFLLRMMGSYARVLYIIATSKNYTIDSYTIKVTRAAIAPFAFFGWIVFPEKFIDHRDLTKMLLHERVHSRQLHSIDLLLGEFFAVFQWFNPASWMLKKLITENHEYTADRAVIDLGVSSYEYQASLVNATVGREVVPVSHFSLILIKKRIKMMNKNRNSAWLRVKGILVPVAFVSALALTSFTVEMGVDKISNDNQTSLSNEVSTTIAQVVDEATFQDDKIYNTAEVMPTFKGKDATLGFREYVAKNLKYPEIALKNGIQGNVYVQFVVEKDGSVSKVKILKGVDPSLDKEAMRVVSQATGWKAGEIKGKPVRVSFTFPIRYMLSDGAKVSKKGKGEEEVFFVAEDMPTFNGKEASLGFREYVGANLKYPEEAAKKGIQGTVYVQFIVEASGEVSNVKVLRGTNPSLDQEAIRIVKNSPRWTPGKQRGKNVRVSFTFPIKFKLDGASETTKTSEDFSKVLKIVNGKEYTGDLNKIEIVDQITVLKGEKAIAKYGEKGKNGVVEITVVEGTSESKVLNGVNIIGKK